MQEEQKCIKISLEFIFLKNGVKKDLDNVLVVGAKKKVI